MDEEQQQHCCAEDIQCQLEEKTLYKDAYISITNQAITLNWYYFPTGTVKVKPLSRYDLIRISPNNPYSASHSQTSST